MNQLKAGAALGYVTIGLRNIIGLMYMPYMLRMLGQHEFGLYSIIGSITAYLTVLDFGFGNALIRYTAKYRAEGRDKEQSALFGMFISIYLAIAVMAIFIGIAVFYFLPDIFSQTMTADDVKKLKIMIALLLINVTFTFPFSVFGSIITAFERFVFLRIATLIRVVLNPLTIILFLSYGYKAIAVVAITSAYNVLMLFSHTVYCLANLKIKISFKSFDFLLLKEIGSYSFFIFLNILMDRIYWNTGQFVLGAYVSTSAVAIYALAITLQGYYMSFSTVISSVFLPRVTGIVTNTSNIETLSDLFIRVGRLQFIVLSLILTGFILLGKTFITLWAGTEYSDSYLYTVLIFIPLSVPLIQNLGVVILQAKNQHRFRAVMYVIIALFSLGLTIILVKIIGGLGAVVGVIAGLVAGPIITINLYYSKVVKLNISRFWKEISSMSIPIMVLLMASHLVTRYLDIDTYIDLFGGAVVYSLLYAMVCWFFVLNSREKQLFQQVLNTVISRVTRKR